MNNRMIHWLLLLTSLFLAPFTLHARWMNPNTGRFWTMDTEEGENGDPLSLHKYLYCQADPVNNCDPVGHDIGDILAVADIFSSLSGFIEPTISTGSQWALRHVSEAEADEERKKCIPWVSTYVSNPDNDKNIAKALKFFDHAETFERVMTVAAIITIGQTLGMAAAIDEAAVEVGHEGLKIPLHFGEDLVDLVNELHGNWGGWFGWTGVPREVTVPGFYFDSKKKIIQWRQVKTDGGVDAGRFQNREDAWKAASQEVRNRIESGDL